MGDNYAKDRIENDFDPTPPPDDIICKDCIFRKPDFVVNGEVLIKGYKNARCDIFVNGKPNDILFRNEDCDFHESE